MDDPKIPYGIYNHYRNMAKTSSTATFSDNFFAGLLGAIAGGITGAIEVSILYPAEYLKTQLQLEDGFTKSQKQYTGIADCVKKTIKSHGVLGLYRGLSVLLIGTIPRAAARFGSFEYFKSLFPPDYKDSTSNLLSGMGAGCFEAVVIVTPMETIRVKLINDQRRPEPQLKGLFHAVRRILKTYGIKGIYRGLTVTVLKEGSSSAIRFSVVEYLKDNYKDNNPDKNVPKLYVGAFGAIAGFASVLANTPLDVVKTRLQGLEGSKYKSTLDCFIKVWQNEGFPAFYKGTVIRLYLVCLSMGISFMAYDALMEHLTKDYIPMD